MENQKISILILGNTQYSREKLNELIAEALENYEHTTEGDTLWETKGVYSIQHAFDISQTLSNMEIFDAHIIHGEMTI